MFVDLCLKKLEKIGRDRNKEKNKHSEGEKGK